MTTQLEMFKVSKRVSICALQKLMTQYPQYVPQTDHYFADGMYCRVVTQEAGVLVVGKVHKREHFFMVIAGEMAIIQDGVAQKVHTAPSVIVSKPGTQRALLSMKDSTYLTIHRTDKTDLDEIEKEMVEEDSTALFNAHNQLRSLTHGMV